MTKKVVFVIFVILAISVGFYPLRYILVGGDIGVLDSKPADLLSNSFYKAAFYTHILVGGLALLAGWSQFSGSIRKKYLQLHRRLGIFYSLCVLFSGLAGVYIGFFATGGLITSIGFILLGLVWLSSTSIAFYAIKNKDIRTHQKWMIVSYAACFAAVTLRLWLPLLIVTFGEFLTAYKIVSWLCWVPNMIVAYFIIKNKGLLHT
ncbi:MAG: DUF2306 domain-containing protein [Flavobacteriaceae bacterium]|nr:MAG: DUF2306 domain-containing protein [Flavobacteriaceae bacterium]